MWIAALLACQDPFGVDRHDLVGFRIASVSVPAGVAGDEIRPLAAVIVDGRTWASSPVDLAWYWVQDDEDVWAIDPLTEADGFGPEPDLVVPAHRQRLAVVARQNQQDRRAFVDLATPGPTLPRVLGFEWTTLDLFVEDLEGPELTLDERRKLNGTATSFLPPGGVGRLEAKLENGGDAVVRWMSTAGTWFELDRSTADWAAADLWLDGEEISGDVTPLPEGPVSVVGLVVVGDGQTTFATEVHVGPPGPGLWTAGRWLPTDTVLDPGAGDAVRGTLVADDTSPVGLRLADATLEDADTVPTRGWGTPALPCLISRDGPFDPSWLLTQICGRDGADGIEVVVLPQVAP